MLTYKYIARDPATGKKVKSLVQAENEAAASKLIQKEGLAPIQVKPLNVDNKSLWGRYKNRITIKDKIIFSRQLSTLINAGLPLVQSLRQVGEQTTNKAFIVVINQIISDVEGGAAFSEALVKHPGVFNDIYVNLIAAGETSGTLDKSLERVAHQQEKDAEILSKVRGALAYPAIVVLVMLGVVGFMITMVLPQVKTIYEDLPGASLPFITRALLFVSDVTVKYWWVLIVVLIVLAYATSRYARTLGGKQVIDRFKMTAPGLGRLYMKLYMARFARTATTLVASGVPLIQMLDIVGRSISNVHIERALKGATEKVKGGKSLSSALEGDPNFLPLVPNMLKVGEQSGALEEMLEKTADYFEKEVDNEIKTISTIIEPALMVLLGITAFIIVAAILLPIYGLAGQTIIK
jgi:type IV pilus assembly protein PilC